MSVVIDEMQVDAQPVGERGGGEKGGGGKGEQQPPKPEEVERALRVRLEREERVWAH
jgi:hypothetical protein